jgi:hypothetical protein
VVSHSRGRGTGWKRQKERGEQPPSTAQVTYGADLYPAASLLRSRPQLPGAAWLEQVGVDDPRTQTKTAFIEGDVAR